MKRNTARLALSRLGAAKVVCMSVQLIYERCKAVLHVNEIDLLVIAFDDDQ